MIDIVTTFLAQHNLMLSFIVSVVTMLILLHLIIVQAKEAVTIRDYVTKYRYRILALLIVFLLSLVPVASYVGLRAFGGENEDLRNLATFSGRLGPLFIAIALEIIFYFKPMIDKNKGGK